MNRRHQRCKRPPPHDGGKRMGNRVNRVGLDISWGWFTDE